jgi:hypothetical protein
MVLSAMISVISVISVLLMPSLLRTPITEPHTQLITDLSDRDFPRQINVLNRVQNPHAFVHRALEGFAA